MPPDIGLCPALKRMSVLYLLLPGLSSKNIKKIGSLRKKTVRSGNVLAVDLSGKANEDFLLEFTPEHAIIAETKNAKESGLRAAVPARLKAARRAAERKEYGYHSQRGRRKLPG